jgi:RHS repeat-associated protein
VTWYDDLNRPIKQAERGFDGSYNATLTDYALNGEIDEESTPYVVNATAPYFTAYAYDALKRPTQAMRHVDVGGNGYVQTDFVYAGRKTTTTVHDKAVTLTGSGACPTNTVLCLQTSRATNASGELMQLVEAPVLNGATTTLTTNYWTEPQGHVVAITDPENALTTASYSALGQRTSSKDPDQGAWTFTYDALGEMLNQTDARGVVTTVTKRDALGRTTEQQAVPPAALPVGLANETIVDRWTFDPVHGVGALGQAQRLRGPNRAAPSANPEVWKEAYGYESATARPSTITTTISEGQVQTLTTSMDYNANGRPDTRTYPSATGANRLRVRTGYNANGHLASLSNADTNAMYWLATAENAWGHVTGESWLNGALTGTHSDYDSTGQTQQKSWFGGGASDQFNYQYDRVGNLKSQARSAAGANATESYTYDALQRLIARSGSGGSASYAYTKSGNLTQKSDYGLGANAYTYPAGKHGVTSVILPENQIATYAYDANGNVVVGNTLNATYDGANRLRTITRSYLLSGAGDKIFCNGFDDGTNHCVNPPSGGTTTWTYGANGERSTELSNQSQGLRYFGPDGYELISATGQSKHELGPVLVTRTGANDTITIELKDRLGSTVDTITGASATLRTYDPFGAARNGNMVTRKNGTLNLDATIHGFTGHTHADDVGLIHMKGRVYDPSLGRFLSVDPVVDTTKSQGLNPYSYLANNPLSGTDPTGNDGCIVAQKSSCTVMNNDSRSADKLGHTTVSASSDGSVRAYGSNGGAVTIASSGNNGAVAGGGIRGAGGQTALNVASTDAGRTANNAVATASGNATANDPSLSRTGVDGWRVTPQGATPVEYAVAYQQWVLPDWLEQYNAWLDRAASAKVDSDLWKLTNTAVVEPLVGAVGGEIIGAAVKVGTAALGAAKVARGARTTGEAFSAEKQALVDMAKADKRKGITPADMQAYKDLNRQLPDPFPTGKVRGPEAHTTGGLHSQQPHGHVGPIDHIPIEDVIP